METESHVQVTDTDSARQYLVHWMRTHFPTDQTFSTYIQSDLAGDFAWQLATALTTMGGAAGASASPAQPFAGPWTRVEDGMPEDRIRVWASTGKFDIGHDCFFGGQSSIQKDQSRMWRYTHSEEPVERPVTHWMSVPNEAPDSEDLRDPFAVLKVLARQN